MISQELRFTGWRGGRLDFGFSIFRYFGTDSTDRLGKAKRLSVNPDTEGIDGYLLRLLA
jgi:hypothetical protein